MESAPSTSYVSDDQKKDAVCRHPLPNVYWELRREEAHSHGLGGWRYAAIRGTY